MIMGKEEGRYLRMKKSVNPTQDNILAGKQMQRMRSYLELSQKQLAEILDISVNMVSYYERGVYGIPDNVKRQLYQKFSVDPNLFVLGNSIPIENLEMQLNSKSYLRALPEEIFAEHLKIVNEIAYEKLIMESQKNRG